MSLVPCRIHQLIIDEVSDAQTVVLAEINGPRFLEIGIGIHEALAIQRLLDGTVYPRPLTHDLLAITITALGAQLQMLRITSCADGTYHAHLALALTTKQVEIDCRPSDGFAVVLRARGAGIEVAAELLMEPGPSQPKKISPIQDLSPQPDAPGQAWQGIMPDWDAFMDDEEDYIDEPDADPHDGLFDEDDDEYADDEDEDPENFDKD